MFPDHVVSELLCLLDIETEGFVAGGGIEPVGPPALVEGPVLEERLPIQGKTLKSLFIRRNADFPESGIAKGPVHDLPVFSEGEFQGIEIRALRRPCPDLPGLQVNPAVGNHGLGNTLSGLSRIRSPALSSFPEGNC